MSIFSNDLKYAFRQLRKSPGFALTVVLVLAMGMGANTIMFSVVHTILLRPLPFHDPDRLVMVWETTPRKGILRGTVSYPNYKDWKEQGTAFERLAILIPHSGTFQGDKGSVYQKAAAVSSDFFPLLGVRPVLGRCFLAMEDSPGSEQVIVLSHDLWQRQFSSDPNIVQRQVKLNDQLYTVTGVLPATFRPFHACLKDVEFYLSLSSVPYMLNDRRGSRSCHVLARLKNGIPLARAQSEMDTLAVRLAEQYPDNREQGIYITRLQDEIVKDIRLALWTLVSAVVILLLIVCANVANLLLLKISRQSKDTAVRAALGAGVGTLIRQTLSESLLLAILGGGLGLASAYWGIHVMRFSLAGYIPRIEGLSLDTSVFLFTAAISILTGLLVSTLPAFGMLKKDILPALQKGSGRSIYTGPHLLHDALVVTEMALAMVLVVGASLLGRSFVSLMEVDLGIRPKNLLTFHVPLSGQVYREEQRRKAFVRDVLVALEALPGVESAGITFCLPFEQAFSVSFQMLEGSQVRSDQKPAGRFQIISPRYFQTMGTSLIKGRFFDKQDMDQTGGRILINETMARRFWPDQDPVGKHIKPGFGYGNSGPSSYEIIGIVQDSKQARLESEVEPEMSILYTHQVHWWMAFAVRTTLPPQHLIKDVQTAVAGVDKDLPLYDIRTMEERLADTLVQQRFSLFMFGAFSLAALLLASLGVYGVMAYAVCMRRQEIGIRLALGARRSDVLGLILKKGLVLGGISLALGILGAIALAWWLGSMLYRVKPYDPFTFVVVPLFLLIVTLLACYLPAHRAAKIDPLETLRYE